MPYLQYSMPQYPVTTDMWDELRAANKPIIVYGMGNGADKLFDRFSCYGIEASDIFASDGFVRGHSFRGMRVKSFSEIKNTYSDFIIVLSFASRKSDVLDMLEAIDGEYDMYIPDMPIADTEEYFDKDFFNAHYNELLDAYNALCDEKSRNAFAAVVNYKLTGRMSYLLGCFSDKDDKYSILSKKKVRCAIDGGAYSGDTLKEFTEHFDELCEAVAVEPDLRNYKKLMRYTEELSGIEVRAINGALWHSLGEGSFLDSGNRNSSISSTASFQYKQKQVQLITVDSLNVAADYIKYDVEGAEYEALLGSHRTIESYRPMLSVSLYHRSRDLFYLTNYLHTKYPFYKIYMRRLRCVPAWEIDLILIPT